jgi:hypothetical protein
VIGTTGAALISWLAWVSGNTWDELISGTGLLGVVLLAVPALHVNRYGRLLARTSGGEATSPALQKKRTQLLAKLKHIQESWTFWKGASLIAGTILAGISFVLGLLKALLAAG